MRVALFQAPSPAGDIPAGLACVQAALDMAAEAQVRMLVMPELFLPGYMATSETAVPGWSTAMERVRAMCRDAKVGLTIGVPEFANGLVYNAAIAIGPGGQELARHRKIQLFGPREASIFAPGDAYTVFDFDGLRFGLLVCYDVEFPEHVRALAHLGCNVVLVPTANMMPFTNVNTFLVPARAAENAMTIVYANYCGSEGALSYVGQSAIFGPDGHSLATKGQNPGFAFADISAGWAEHGLPPATQRADYRPITIVP